MDVIVRARNAEAEPVEIVEHKGIGHPDTICDALAEELSAALSREYIDRFGTILHHNVDKAVLHGGAARAELGGGEVLEPMRLFLVGRATREARGVVVPVDEIARDVVERWLRASLHAVDPARHVVVDVLVRPGAAELVELFGRGQGAAVLANDTSVGAGYAPHTELERVVLEVATALKELARKPESAHVGEDIKVMGVRVGDRIHLTVACAFIGRFLPNLTAYVDRRAELGRHLTVVAGRVATRDVHVDVNAADDVERGSIYLTVTGTSAEAGDDGQVGRGNRVNGLITPYRPMTLEAAAGKNPVSHVGKLYSVAAHRIAAALVASSPRIRGATCWLVSQIGRRVDDPPIADVRLDLERGDAVDGPLAKDVEAVVRAGVEDVPTLWRRIVRREIALY